MMGIITLLDGILLLGVNIAGGKVDVGADFHGNKRGKGLVEEIIANASE